MIKLQQDKLIWIGYGTNLVTDLSNHQNCKYQIQSKFEQYYQNRHLTSLNEIPDNNVISKTQMSMQLERIWEALHLKFSLEHNLLH